MKKIIMLLVLVGSMIPWAHAQFTLDARTRSILDLYYAKKDGSNGAYLKTNSLPGLTNGFLKLDGVAGLTNGYARTNEYEPDKPLLIRDITPAVTTYRFNNNDIKYNNGDYTYFGNSGFQYNYWRNEYGTTVYELPGPFGTTWWLGEDSNPAHATYMTSGSTPVGTWSLGPYGSGTPPTVTQLTGMQTNTASMVASAIMGTPVTHLIPDMNERWDLGSPSKKWRELYLSGNTIHLGDEGVGISAITGAIAMTIGGTNPDQVVTVSMLPSITNSMSNAGFWEMSMIGVLQIKTNWFSFMDSFWSTNLSGEIITRQ